MQGKSIKHPNKMNITEKTLRELIESDIAREERAVKEHETILAMLTDVNGKDINGRTFTPKRLNGFAFEIKASSMYHIKGEFSHLIGYNSSPVVDIAAFERYDSCHAQAARERIAQNKALLSPEKFNEVITLLTTFEATYIKLKEQFKALESAKVEAYHFPIFYEVLNLIQPDKEERQKINLTNLRYY